MSEVKKIFSSQILPYDNDSTRQEIKRCVIKMRKKTIIESEIANLKEAKKKSRSDHTIIEISNKIFHLKKKIKEQEKDL